MNAQLIPLLAEAINNYIPEDELIDLCNIFETEIPKNTSEQPNVLQLSRRLVQEPEHGSNRELLNAIIPLVLTRNDKLYSNTSFERRHFHASLGNKIQVLNTLVGEQTVPSSITVTENQPFTAKSEVRELVSNAVTILTVVDAYIGTGTLDCLRDVTQPIKLLTGDRGNSIENGFEHALKDFRSEDRVLEIRTHKKLHDRYVLFNERCWLIGSSLKDAGKKTFNIVEIVDFRKEIFAEIEKKWKEGSLIHEP